MTQTITKEQNISERAYEIWQAEGCPHGRALEHWLAAEREINGKVASINTEATPGVAAKKRSSQTVTVRPERVFAVKTSPSNNGGGTRKPAQANPGKNRHPVN